MRASVISIVSLLVIATNLGGPLRAEPGPVGKWLMDEPTSLWDLGMLRLEKIVDDWKGLKDSEKDTYYDWNQNRIIIDLVENLSPMKSFIQTEGS